MNQLLFGTGEVTVPEHVVGHSERAQIEERLSGWVEDAKVGFITPLAYNVFSKSIADHIRLST